MVLELRLSKASRLNLEEVIEILLAPRLAADAEDVSGVRLRIETDEVQSAGPDVAFVGQKIVNLIAFAFR